MLVRPAESQVCKINGKFPGIREVVISYNGSSFLDIIKDTIATNSDGSFSYEVLLPGKPRKCYLSFSERELVVWAVTSTEISIELGSNGQLIFAGETKDIQYYLLNKDDEWAKIYKNFQKKDLFQHLSKPYSDEYFHIQDQITSSRIQYLKNSIYLQNKDKLLHDNFVRRETDELIFSNLYYKLNYGSARIDKFEFTSKKGGGQSGEYYGYTKKDPFNDRELLKSHQFLEFSNMFFIQLAIKSIRRQNLAGKRETYLREVFAAVDSISPDEYCSQIHKIYFLMDELKDLTYEGSEADLTPELFDRYLATIEKHPLTVNEVAKLKSLVQAKYIELKNLAGSSIDNCILVDQSGQPFDLTLLQGKLIYIDVWASWCSPCLESMPLWDSLVKKWESNKNITFLMVSIDATAEKWKNALVKYKPAGLQLISPGDFKESDFAKKLKLDVLPAYILISSNGKIITTRAPRPGSIQLTTLLELYSPR